MPTDISTPLDLARAAYDAADHTREPSECVALHLERQNRALRFLREAKRSAQTALAALTAIEATLEDAEAVTQ